MAKILTGYGLLLENMKIIYLVMDSNYTERNKRGLTPLFLLLTAPGYTFARAIQILPILVYTSRTASSFQRFHILERLEIWKIKSNFYQANCLLINKRSEHPFANTRSPAVRDALRINGRRELRLDRSWELRESCVYDPGTSNFNGRGGAAINGYGRAAIGAAKELRFGTNVRPWEFDKKNQIFTAPHFNVNKNLRN